MHTLDSNQSASRCDQSDIHRARLLFRSWHRGTQESDLQRDSDLTTAQARAREAEQQAKRLYVGGKIDFLALLDAQRTLASADDAVASSHARLATDQVGIFLALGGGW